MKTQYTIASTLLAAALGSGVALAAQPATPAAPAAPVSAVTPPATTPAPGTWLQHKYTFTFMGFTTTYSCDGLADKLRILLKAAGARADAKSWPGACASSYGHPDKFARADLTFYSLAPVATGAAADPHPVTGDWRHVEFKYRSPHELELGDCELVEQFRNNVLPMFLTRNVENHTTCVPHQFSGSIIDMSFDVFAPLPAKGANKAG